MTDLDLQLSEPVATNLALRGWPAYGQGSDMWPTSECRDGI